MYLNYSKRLISGLQGEIYTIIEKIFDIYPELQKNSFDIDADDLYRLADKTEISQFRTMLNKKDNIEKTIERAQEYKDIILKETGSLDKKVREIFNKNNIDSKNSPVSDYYWGKIVPMVLLNGERLPPYSFMRQCANIAASNLKISCSYNISGSSDTEKQLDAYRSHISTVCRLELNRAEALSEAENIKNDIENMIDIVKDFKAGYIDKDKLNKALLLKKMEQLAMLSDKVRCSEYKSKIDETENKMSVLEEEIQVLKDADTGKVRDDAQAMMLDILNAEMKKYQDLNAHYGLNVNFREYIAELMEDESGDIEKLENTRYRLNEFLKRTESVIERDNKEINAVKLRDKDITAEDIRKYITGRKGKEIRILSESLSSKNRMVDEILASIEYGYPVFVNPATYDRIVKLQNTNTDKEFREMAGDVLEEIREYKHPLSWIDIKNGDECIYFDKVLERLIESGIEQPGAMSEKNESIEKMTNIISPDAYNAISNELFYKVMHLKEIDGDEFLDSVDKILKDLRVNHPGLENGEIYSMIDDLYDDSLISREMSDRKKIDKVHELVEQFNCAGAEPDEDKEKILDVFYSQISGSALLNKKLAKKCISPYLSGFGGWFAGHDEKVAGNELTKLAAYSRINDEDLIYIARDVCKYSRDRIDENIENIRDKKMKDASGRLDLIAEYLTGVMQEYLDILKQKSWIKSGRGSSVPAKKIESIVSDICYNFYNDYLVHKIYVDLFSGNFNGLEK